MHGCILAYGQTGSGKTHSLLNGGSNADTASEDVGLLVRVVSDLFVHVAADPRHVYTIKIAMAQIYNESIDDCASRARGGPH